MLNIKYIIIGVIILVIIAIPIGLFLKKKNVKSIDGLKSLLTKKPPSNVLKETVTKNTDGSSTIKSPTGEEKTINSDGSTVEKLPDGTKTKTEPNGDYTKETPGGDKIEKKNDTITTTQKNGNQKIINETTQEIVEINNEEKTKTITKDNVQIVYDLNTNQIISQNVTTPEDIFKTCIIQINEETFSVLGYKQDNFIESNNQKLYLSQCILHYQYLNKYKISDMSMMSIGQIIIQAFPLIRNATQVFPWRGYLLLPLGSSDKIICPNNKYLNELGITQAFTIPTGLMNYRLRGSKVIQNFQTSVPFTFNESQIDIDDTKISHTHTYDFSQGSLDWSCNPWYDDGGNPTYYDTTVQSPDKTEDNQDPLTDEQKILVDRLTESIGVFMYLIIGYQNISETITTEY